MNVECNNLDGYLSGDLPKAAASRFISHLERCDACSDLVEQQRWIDSMLQSDAGAALERPSLELINSLQASVERRNETGRMVRSVVAVAASIAIVVAGWLALRSQQTDERLVEQPTIKSAREVSGAPQPNEVPAESTRATFVSNGNNIAVAIESEEADVSVVQLYPTVESERRRYYEMLVADYLSDSNGG